MNATRQDLYDSRVDTGLEKKITVLYLWYAVITAGHVFDPKEDKM